MPEHLDNSLSVIRASDGEGRAIALHCSKPDWRERAAVLKREERAWVLAGDSPAGPVVVKSMTQGRMKGFLGRLFGQTRLMRQWRGAQLLRKHGFVVAMPIVLWQERDARRGIIESLAMPRLRGVTVLDALAEGSAGSKAMEIARAAGAMVGRLARLGLLNRDHKPSNLLVLDGDRPGETPPIAILDTVGIRRCDRDEALERMLFSLIVEPIGCGIRVPIALRVTAVRAALAGTGLPAEDLRRVWNAVQRRFDAHGDPTPRINPLAPPRRK